MKYESSAASYLIFGCAMGVSGILLQQKRRQQFLKRLQPHFRVSEEGPIHYESTAEPIREKVGSVEIEIPLQKETPNPAYNPDDVSTHTDPE